MESQNNDLGKVRFSIDDVFLIKDLEHLQYFNLIHKVPVGVYTMQLDAIYAGRQYTLGIKLQGIDQTDMSHVVSICLNKAKVIKDPVYNSDLDMFIFDVIFDASHIPALDETSLPTSLWVLSDIHLTVNGVVVSNHDGGLVSIPVSFNCLSSTMSGTHFFESDDAFMVIQPGEDLILDVVSGAGGGAGINLPDIKGETGDNGGDAFLCYVIPDTDDVQPITYIEGGLGGRISTKALQTFKLRSAKSHTFIEGWVNNFIHLSLEYTPHNTPVSDLEDTTGGKGQSLPDTSIVSVGGTGGYLKDVGYRGEGGMSGGKVSVRVHYRAMSSSTPGPFIILHPKTMVNLFDVLKDIKIKKTKKPMLGGTGGFSLTQSGTDGLSGTLNVRTN